MALALFRKRTSAAADAEPSVPAPAANAPPATGTEAIRDPAKDILGLLELELGAMIRQLEHTATSVAGGADGTAATLQTIRQRTDALTGRAGTASQTAATFTEAADRFTSSA
ncbi:MAG: methyl-accepting chemotaxis protein, partial [Xanthobacteraceae bacterium]